MHKNEEVKLTDLIDIKFLQEFQDSFSKAMGVASLIFDVDGPVTEPSNYVDFCKYLYSIPEWKKKCQECDLSYVKIIAEKTEPLIGKCYIGLSGLAVPIKLRGKHIGAIECGQFFTEPLDENYAREVAKQVGLSEDECIRMLRQLKVIPMEQIKEFAHLLYIVANTVVEIAYKNLGLTKKEDLLRNILKNDA